MTGKDIFEVVALTSNTINLFPKNLHEEIMQNIRVILTTIIGSVPLDRRFGLDIRFIDEPTPKGKMELVIFITESIQEYEKRVSVEEVTFVNDPTSALVGRMYPKVRVRIKDEYIE